MKVIRNLVITFSILGLTACAESPTKEAALIVAGHIDQYEKAVGAKVKAETDKNQAEVASLKSAALRRGALEVNVELDEMTNAFADQALVDDKRLKISALAEFLHRYNEFMRARADKQAVRVKALRDKYAVSFAKLSFDRKTLRSLREKVMVLARDETTRANLERLIAVIRDGAKQAIDLKKNVDDQSSK